MQPAYHMVARACGNDRKSPALDGIFTTPLRDA
jgi:hypothetical protein